MRKIRAPRARPRQRAQKSGDYEVGYGKPPEQSRFKPGQSGNPKGRPKGVRNFKTDVQTTLKAPVKVIRGGKPRNVSTQEASLLRLREKALGGDARALDRLLGFAQAYNNEELSDRRRACPPTMRRSSRFTGARAERGSRNVRSER